MRARHISHENEPDQLADVPTVRLPLGEKLTKEVTGNLAAGVRTDERLSIALTASLVKR